jgi:hypothetical protein
MSTKIIRITILLAEIQRGNFRIQVKLYRVSHRARLRHFRWECQMMMMDKQGRVVRDGCRICLNMTVLAFWWPQQSVIVVKLWKASRSDSPLSIFPYRADFKGLILHLSWKVVKKISVGKPEGRRRMGRSRMRWLEDVEMDLREMATECSGERRMGICN